MAKLEPVSTTKLKVIMPEAVFSLWEAVIAKIGNLIDKQGVSFIASKEMTDEQIRPAYESYNCGGEVKNDA
jgi:hypothetical protein